MDDAATIHVTIHVSVVILPHWNSVRDLMTPHGPTTCAQNHVPVNNTLPPTRPRLRQRMADVVAPGGAHRVARRHVSAGAVVVPGA